MDSLGRLIKSGLLARLEVINLALRPEAAEQHGAQSAPWTRIGPFELVGAHPYTELESWARHASQGTGYANYYAHLLETQRAHKVSQLIASFPETIHELADLIEDVETPITVKIGIGVVFEDLSGQPPLLRILPKLERLALSEAPNVRGDAAHYLGLTQSRAALPALHKLAADEFPDVREIADESIALIEEHE
jgi:hypothetical protein